MIRNYSLANPIHFVGRTKEIGDISERLTNPECRLLTLTGLGGSGKTRLAIEASKTVAAHFTHGTVFVGLQPLATSDLLIPTIAQAVGLTFHGKGELQNQLLDFLHEKSLLLILDNFEHLLAGAALVSEILASAPGVKILVTSREALNLLEEWLYPLKGMSTPHSIYSTALEDYEAVQLFLFHARRVQPNFELANEHESVIQICIMTAGLPLAIELAASWLKGLSITQIVQEMQRNLNFLSTNTRNVEERHRSMRAVFDQSWKLLSENERLIFAQLTVFYGGFDGAAAEHVAEASFSSLAALVEKSLIQMESADRFGIHELLRQYGKEKLEAYGETEAAHARHSQYFAQLMLQHETALQQPQQVDAMRAIESDFENIRLAWNWSAQNQQTTQLHMMLNTLYLFGFLRSRYRETTTIFHNTLEQSVSDESLLGRLLARRWGYLHWWYQEDYQDALAGIEQALSIAVAENNAFEIALARLMYAYVMIGMQRYTEALPHLESSKALFDAVKEPYYVCWVLHRIGYVYSNLNNTAKSKEYTEQSLVLARTTYNSVGLVICLYNLGSDHIFEADYIKGKLYCEESLHFAIGAGHQGQIAHALSLLALCAFFEGDFEIAQDYAERSRIITEDIYMLVFQPYAYSVLILLACLREDYIEATRLKEAAGNLNTNSMGYQLYYRALAILACGLGNPSEARLHIDKVLDLTNLDAKPAVVGWIIPAVIYALAETNPEKTVELLSWVFVYPDIALHWVRQWPLVQRLQSHLQDGMDTDLYQTHWQKGKTLTLETVINDLRHEFLVSSHTTQDGLQQQLLTIRELEILQLLATGLTNPQIAEQLVIGSGTVKTHTLNIYRKLDVANRTQAIVRAQELGLLNP